MTRQEKPQDAQKQEKTDYTIITLDKQGYPSVRIRIGSSEEDYIEELEEIRKDPERTLVRGIYPLSQEQRKILIGFMIQKKETQSSTLEDLLKQLNLGGQR